MPSPSPTPEATGRSRSCSPQSCRGHWPSSGVDADSKAISRVVSAFAELEPESGLGEALERAAGAGVKLLALTNGSADSTRQLLDRAGVLDRFAALLSCDEVRRTKPHPDVYAMAKREAEGELWLVAAHSWDVAGAVMAGPRGAHSTRAGGVL